MTHTVIVETWCDQAESPYSRRIITGPRRGIMITQAGALQLPSLGASGHA